MFLFLETNKNLYHIWYPRFGLTECTRSPFIVVSHLTFTHTGHPRIERKKYLYFLSCFDKSQRNSNIIVQDIYLFIWFKCFSVYFDPFWTHSILLWFSTLRCSLHIHIHNCYLYPIHLHATQQRVRITTTKVHTFSSFSFHAIVAFYFNTERKKI